MPIRHGSFGPVTVLDSADFEAALASRTSTCPGLEIESVLPASP